MKYYPLELFWSEEDEGYIALVPDLPGCNAWGATEMEAIEQVHDAIEAWQTACKQAGEPVPEPSNRLEETSVMAASKTVYIKIAKLAKQQGISITQYLEANV
jgi:predicted RNase H-like HicB family nuclease